MAFTHVPSQQLMYIFGILGNIVSLGVFLSPMPTFIGIIRRKSTGGFQALPYSVALFSCMLLLYYAMLKTENATLIITINLVGFFIETFYLSIFLLYAPKKAKVYTFKLIGLFNILFLGVILLVTILFAHGQDKHHMLSKGGVRESAVGWICAVFSVCVFAAPLSVMRMVIRTKSVEFMPFWLSFSLTLCAVMWFLYGFLIKDFYIACPNILGFLLGITQMLLFIIYKDSSKKQLKGLVITDTDIKQLQAELAIDIKLTKIEKIDPEFPPEIEIVMPQVVEIIVHDMEIQGKCETEVGIKKNDEIIQSGIITVGKPPRGGNDV